MYQQQIGIIGAGPAGLTAAYLLAKAGKQVVVFEKDPVYVGGISRTERYKGYRFDIGGHRFFSKSKEVEDFWTEILGDEMLDRPRSSRIYYNKKFFSYPLMAVEALRKLGLAESALCVLSYLQAKWFPVKNPKNFEEWVTNQFGKRLFRIFFKTYTEKVWGIPCTDISADWAAQRIKGLSLSAAIRNAVFPHRQTGGKTIIKTLIDTFRYPRLGPGQMWEVCAEKIKKMGGTIHMGQAVSALHYDRVTGKWNIGLQDETTREGFDAIISGAPLQSLARVISPILPPQALEAAGKLGYRDFITVVLITPDTQHLTDNWIYIHDPEVKVGRIQNFKSWSPYLVPDEAMACYGLEYFCFEGDGLWNSSDDELAALGKYEMEKIGLACAAHVTDTYVVRQPKAYPVYDHSYQQHVDTIRGALKQYPGLHLVGRNGMHKYNNQDHSMMTAMLAARNIVAGEPLYDLWQVNGDAEYHETIRKDDNTGRLVPKRLE